MTLSLIHLAHEIDSLPPVRVGQGGVRHKCSAQGAFVTGCKGLGWQWVGQFSPCSLHKLA